MKLILICTLLLGLTISANAGLDSLFYQPTSSTYTTPEQDGLAFEEITFMSKDQTRLSGWFIPAEGKALGTVIHFHGNAQNMSAHYSFVSWLPKNGFNLFVFDYRGYGTSAGEPSREGIYQDCVAAIEYIKTRQDIDQNKLIIFGQSIGGANAITVVGNNDFSGIRGIATDSAFSSYKRVACEHTGLLKPFAYLLISNELSPEKYVGNIAPTPLLIIHGTHDRVASYRNAEELFAAASEPKQLWTVDQGTHTSALGPSRKTYVPRLHRQFVQWVSD
ncbi:alpha/beta hydrolase [Pontiellaceae bacterium B1224]|nr:alpha/beta hydrolase [Pontiellaceae bacterium B1224]